MELKACIQAFEEILKYPHISRFKHIKIYSDSSYVVNNQGNAIYIWPKSKYRRLSGGLVENADLWKEWLKKRQKLSKMLRGVRIDVTWRNRRSSDHMRNVDNIAKASSAACIGKPFRAVGVRRHRLPVRPGGVNFFGQKMTIHIVTAEKMKVQGMNKYSCQVISKSNADYKRKGVIYTPDSLREGRRYTITCNERPNDPGTCNIEIHRRYKTKKELNK